VACRTFQRRDKQDAALAQLPSNAAFAAFWEIAMQKRTFLVRSTAALALAGLTLGLSGCTTTTGAAKPDNAAVRTQIEQGSYNTLERLYKEVKGSRELVHKANGVLVFPNVIAAGLVVGGEYGKGVLRTGGQTVSYYSVASVSVGFQAGRAVQGRGDPVPDQGSAG
jgi:hypothetical protein